MSSSADNTHTYLVRLFILIPTALVLGGIWIAVAVSHYEAAACTGSPEAPVLVEIQGTITHDPIRIVKFFISGNGHKAIVSNYRLSPLNKELSQSLNKPAHAAYCMNQLIFLDIEGKRLFTRDVSPVRLLVTGAICMGCFALAYILTVYGLKQISLRALSKRPQAESHS